jgi:hypothetical protein
MSNNEVRLRLTGWKAIVVLLAMAGFVGFKWFHMQTTLSTEAVALVKTELQGQYTSTELRKTQSKSLQKNGSGRVHRSVQKWPDPVKRYQPSG